MRGADKLVLLVAVLVPLVVATLGWPMFVNWVAGPPRAQPTPETAGAAATSVAAARATFPTPRPTIGAPPTVPPRGNQPAAAARAPEPPVAEPTPEPPVAEPPAPTPIDPAVARTGDPGQAVQNFYALVSNHQFDTAAQLWSPRMRAAFPPGANINQRFSQTRSIDLQRADVLSQDQSQAIVAVDLVESSAQAGRQHFVGTWRLVRGAGGWMLDQPNLQPAP